jgi:putative hydrolase of the HAD superfamily
MRVHKVEPGPFLDYVHDIDLSVVQCAPALREALAALPGRKLIFTNGSQQHAERVAAKLGILDQFDGICDIAACEYAPKPTAEAFDRMIRRHDVEARSAAMFEDLPHNLSVPHQLGMTTVLVHSGYMDHPSQQAIAGWRELPEYIHYLTSDLTAFLAGLSVPQPR